MKALALVSLFAVMTWTGLAQAESVTALCVDKEAQEALGKIEIVRTADVDYLYFYRDRDAKSSLKLIIREDRIYNNDPSIDLGAPTFLGEITGADDQFINLRLFQTRLACMRDE